MSVKKKCLCAMKCLVTKNSHKNLREITQTLCTKKCQFTKKCLCRTNCLFTENRTVVVKKTFGRSGYSPKIILWSLLSYAAHIYISVFV
jgi:hypothetical protein